MYLNKSHVTRHTRAIIAVDSGVQERTIGFTPVFTVFLAKSPYDYFFFFQIAKLNTSCSVEKENVLVLVQKGRFLVLFRDYNSSIMD